MEPIGLERKSTLWIGVLLLHEGHVVELPNGRPELRVHVGKGIRRLFVSMRDQVVSRVEGRVTVGTITDLENDAPDAVVIVARGSSDIDSISIVPVQQTRVLWIQEGLHYTLPSKHVGDFGRLQTWLSRLAHPTSV